MRSPQVIMSPKRTTLSNAIIMLWGERIGLVFLARLCL